MIKIENDILLMIQVENINKKIGKELLIDDEILILAFDEILRTYTHDEKNYNK